MSPLWIRRSRTALASIVALLALVSSSCKRSVPPDVAAFQSCQLDPGAPVPAQFRGYHYPFQGEQLSTLLTRLMNTTGLPAPEAVTALVVPHGGFDFSGPTAAAAFASVRDRRYERVVILGPSHNHKAQGAVLPTARAFNTPLGEVPVDSIAVTFLANEPGFTRSNIPFRDEQSIEDMLPFMQKTLGSVPIVPILVGPLDEPGAKQIATALHQVLDSRSLLVVSSNLTLYGDRFGYKPYGEKLLGKELRAKIAEADKIILQALIGDDSTKLQNLLDPPKHIKAFEGGLPEGAVGPDENTSASASSSSPTNSCGRDVLRLLLATLPSGSVGLLKHYDNSFTHDELNNRDQVSYAAIAYPGTWPDVPPFSDADQKVLLGYARAALTAAVEGKQPAPPAGGSARLTERRGAFVTLVKDGELRGSVGRAESDDNLMQTVAALAQAAAHDSRYPPLSKDELSQVKIEVSVLGPMRNVKQTTELQLGVDGLFVNAEGHNALLLPQVASELHLSQDQFLDTAAEKADWPRSQWKPEHLRTFTVQVIAEPGAVLVSPPAAPDEKINAADGGR
jgi:AmmeMemoRadiSam system protein B/AmmeMemoRadiSam system protein A